MGYAELLAVWYAFTMKLERRSIWFVLPPTVIGAIILWCYSFNHRNWIVPATSILTTILTFYYVLLTGDYVRITRDMVRQMREAQEQELRPWILIEIVHKETTISGKPTSNTFLRLRNAGKTPAISLKVSYDRELVKERVALSPLPQSFESFGPERIEDTQLSISYGIEPFVTV